MVKVASLPVVFVKFNEALKNPYTTNRDLEKILSEDSALAARVLRIANSAMYNFPARIDTVARAITVLGQQQLHDIVLACSVVQMFKDIPQEMVDMESFWLHSIACGAAARILASFRRQPNTERFFAAGLLHDIGRLICYLQLPRPSAEALALSRERGQVLYRSEREVMGFDHAKVGGLLLKAWRLPEALVSAVAHHHRPQAAGGYALEAGIVHVADIMCHALRYGTSGEVFVPPLQEEAWQHVDLPVDVIPPALDQLAVQTGEAVKFILGNGT